MEKLCDNCEVPEDCFLRNLCIRKTLFSRVDADENQIAVDSAEPAQVELAGEPEREDDTKDDHIPNEFFLKIIDPDE